MFNSDAFRPKVKVEVNLVLSDGTTMTGDIFTSPQGRLLDTLNDDRVFLPIEIDGKGISVINKTLISTITPVNQTPTEQENMKTEWQSAFARATMETEEAFKVLGLPNSASKNDIIAARRRLLAGVHPDAGGSTYLAAKVNQAVTVLNEAKKKPSKKPPKSTG